MKEKLYTISKIVLWILLIGNLLSFLSFTSRKQSRLAYQSVQVSIVADQQHNRFITEQLIETALLDTLKLASLVGQTIEKYTPAYIERILAINPYVKKSVVYTDIPGNLYIQVMQRRPIARVMTEHFDYYITENGSKMPWCSNYTARVPLVTGDFFEGMDYQDSMITEKGREIYTFLQAIDTSEFYKAFCDQLFYSADNPDLKMIPKVGNNEIIFGNVSNLSDKLNKLRVFYSKVLNNGTLYRYKSINLKFNNQVVCEMHDSPVSTDTSN